MGAETHRCEESVGEGGPTSNWRFPHGSNFQKLASHLPTLILGVKTNQDYGGTRPKSSRGRQPSPETPPRAAAMNLTKVQ